MNVYICAVCHCEDPYKEYSHVYVYMCDTVNALKFVDTNVVVGVGKIYMSISRFSLRDKVTLRLLKLYFYIEHVAAWSGSLDIRLSDCCCSV